MDYAALRAELQRTTPLDYTGLTDQQAADRLMATDNNRTLPRGTIDTWEMREAVVQSEYAALSAANRQWLDMILAGERVPTGAGNIRTGLLALFGAGTQTRTNLAALQTRTVSRAEELGLGLVTPGDVALARAKDGGW